jgi:hypothetical protein
MSVLEILTIASALLIAASSFAMAQQPRRHAPVHVAHSTVRTGTAMNRHKMHHGYYPRTR